MGQIASLGECRLTDRFGLEGRRAWRLCTGTDDEAIHPMAFRGYGGRADVAVLPHLHRSCTLAGRRHPPQEGFRQTGDEGEVRGQGLPAVRCDRVAVLGEEHLIQGARRELGGRIVCHQQQTGVGPAGHSPWRR